MSERKKSPQTKTRTYTESEKTKLLVGYITVPRNLWAKIGHGTHLRYVRKDGRFCAGGTVSRGFGGAAGEGADLSFYLKSGFQSFGRKVPYSEIKTVYVRPDVGSVIAIDMMKGAIQALNDNIVKLSDRIKKLNERVTYLEKKMG